MFKVFQKILLNQTVTEVEGMKISEFILLRWLSGDPRLVSLAATLNSADLRSLQLKPHILANAIGKALRGQIRFIKYPKQVKEEKEKQDLALQFSKYFEVSVTEALEYVAFCKRNCPDEIVAIQKIFSKQNS